MSTAELLLTIMGRTWLMTEITYGLHNQSFQGAQ